MGTLGFLAQKLVIDLRRLCLRIDHVSVVEPEVYMVKEGALEQWRPLEEDHWKQLTANSGLGS